MTMTVRHRWRMGAMICLCVTGGVACSHETVQPYMVSRMTAPLKVPEGLGAQQASHEMDVPEAVLERLPDEEVPLSKDGEALPPGLMDGGK